MTQQPQLDTFLTCLEQGNRRRCFNLVREWEQQKLPNETLYNDILIPALVHIGSSWEHNKQGIVEEHVATQIVKSVISYKAATFQAGPQLQKTALVGCVPGEHHEVASMLMANILEEQGWIVTYYGTSVPTPDLVSSAKNMQPDLICLTMKSIGCLESTVELLSALRSAVPRSNIMVGGSHIPSVHAILSEHADIIAGSLVEGAREAERLAAS